jgi:SNF2 family DNA or RNA helicase
VPAGPVSCGCVLDGELVFLPNEIPRRGVFALWGKGPGDPVSGDAKVELVFPGGTYGIRKRLVSAELIPVAEALPLLLGTEVLSGLKQICNHPAQYLKQPGPLPGRSGKLALFDELTDMILAGGESMLVFTQYTQMAALLQQHLDARGIRSLFLHGGVPVRRREEMVAEFQAGGVPVFLLSLKAGGTGLTLTRATHVLHYDRWWNPAVEDQATDRAYRIGQDRPVQVHRLIAEGTLEDRIAALLEKKRDLADAVIGSGERWIAELSDSELTELVSLRAAS